MPATSDHEFTNRLVFLHGFTQTHHHWHRGALALAERLRTEPSLAFVDLPGHGLSRLDTSPIATGASAVAELAGAGTYVGYSMGGRFALLAALARPDLVERLVLIGATPGIDDDDERSERRRVDDDRAARLEEIGVHRFLDEWLAAPMFAALPDDPDALAHRGRNTVAGLGHSLRQCGTGFQPSVWSRLGEIAVPVLVLTGERDTKFAEIGRRIAATIPDATFRSVPGAGHAAHVEAEGPTSDLIATWLSGE